MSRRSCVVCGKAFEAQRSTAKYCGSSCRARASVSPGVVAVAGEALAGIEGGLVGVTRAALEAAGVLDTVAGQQAVLLAERMTATGETGAAVASTVALALSRVNMGDP